MAILKSRAFVDTLEGPKRKAEPSRTLRKGQKERHGLHGHFFKDRNETQSLHGHLGKTNMKGRDFMDTLEGPKQKAESSWTPWKAKSKKTTLAGPKGPPRRVPHGQPKSKRTTLAGVRGGQTKKPPWTLWKSRRGPRMTTKEQKTAKTGAPKDPRDVNFQSRKRSKHDKTRGFGMHRSTQKM